MHSAERKGVGVSRVEGFKSPSCLQHSEGSRGILHLGVREQPSQDNPWGSAILNVNVLEKNPNLP